MKMIYRKLPKTASLPVHLSPEAVQSEFKRSLLLTTAYLHGRLTEQSFIKHFRSNSMPKFLPDELYHYTGIRGLKGIINSQTLWATHYRYLNDTEEVTLFRDR